jgi:hypothetical protein
VAGNLLGEIRVALPIAARLVEFLGAALRLGATQALWRSFVAPPFSA